MIDLAATKKLTELEQELKKLNDLVSNELFKKYMAKIDSSGSDFHAYLKNKGFEISKREDSRSSPQSKTFVAKYGRIELALRCVYRQYSSSPEYWDLEITDDNYKKTSQLIDITPNIKIETHSIFHSGTTEEKIALAEKYIKTAKESIDKLQKLEFQLSLRNGYEKNLDNIIPDILSLLDKQFK